MEDLIKALQILAKYTKAKYPINCSHDLLYVDVNPEKVTTKDREALDRLDFFIDEDLEGFCSYRFGSC